MTVFNKVIDLIFELIPLAVGILILILVVDLICSVFGTHFLG